MLHVVFSLLHVAKLHAASDLRCTLHVASRILPVLHAVSCCLFLHVVISVARCPFCTLYAVCGMLRGAGCALPVASRPVCNNCRTLGFTLHLAFCVFHVAHRVVYLAHAAAAAPTDDGALAHARGTWVGTYPITVVPASPMTASPTTVGKAAATSACAPPRSTCAHPLPHPSAA